MPNRLIRDGILESEAVLSLPVEGRWLFITIMLSADDLGLFEATSFKLARRADIRREMADGLMQLIADADLVRLYEVGGKKYGFIPRFRQRLQIKRSRHPMPNAALMADDEDAVNKINDLASKTTVAQQMGSGYAAVTQPSEPEPEPEKNTGYGEEQSSPPTADCPQKEILALWANRLPSVRQPREWTASRASLLKARWREKKNRQNLDWWDRFFVYISQSDFLMGNVSSPGRKPFDLSIDWVLKLDHFVNIIEGKYHAKETA